MTRPSRSTAASFAALLAPLAVTAAGCGPGFGADTRPKIVIMFGIDADTLEGVDVEIDGKVVGKLERFGDNPRTVFLVEKGKHRVRLRHPELACREAVVNAERDTQRVNLMVDYAESFEDGRAGKTILVLQDG